VNSNAPWNTYDLRQWAGRFERITLRLHVYAATDVAGDSPLRHRRTFFDYRFSASANKGTGIPAIPEVRAIRNKRK
jgi:hypothetical protein